MKKRSTSLILAFWVVVAASLTGCEKPYELQVSNQNLWFDLEASTQTITIQANCKWTVIRNDNADWYTVSPMSGNAKDSIITVTVNYYSGGDYRGSSFVVSAPGGHIRRTVFVSQNKIDFYGMINKVYGVMSIERWNTDFYGQMIEETYELHEYNPYDTTRGYLMYFLEDGIGVQRDHRKVDTVFWHPFHYEFDPENLILKLDFQLVGGGLESYAPEVLTASDSLYRVFHEFKPNFWERSDMRKVGTVTPQEKAVLRRHTPVRKGGEPIFMK